MSLKGSNFYSTKKLVFVSLFTAINVIMSASFMSVPVPGGHLYLNDIVICFSALVFDPFSAFIIGGVGAFLGDFIFYPTPMFVTLITRSVQAVLISVIVGKKTETFKKWKSLIALIIGAVIMVLGYSLGRAYFYSTVEYAMLKLPYQIAQALIGVIVAFLLTFNKSIRRLVMTIPKK